METFEILFYLIRFVIETGFLLLALWGMVRIQQFQYTFPGLLGSAALACALDMIPHFGHYLAVPTLYLCLLKVTREDLTGVIFTAAVSYALVFALNLFLIGSLMGSLRMSARARTQPEASVEQTQEQDQAGSDTDETSPPSQAAKPAQLPSAPAAERAAASADDSKTPSDRGFCLKGVINSSKAPAAMIATGGKTYTLFIGEPESMETDAGRVKVTLEKIGESSVVLNVGGEHVEVRR